jgi:hypothetical protein
VRTSDKNSPLKPRRSRAAAPAPAVAPVATATTSPRAVLEWSRGREIGGVTHALCSMNRSTSFAMTSMASISLWLRRGSGSLSAFNREKIPQRRHAKRSEQQVLMPRPVMGLGIVRGGGGGGVPTDRMERTSLTWHGMAWHGMAWHGMARYGTYVCAADCHADVRGRTGT